MESRRWKNLLEVWNQEGSQKSGTELWEMRILGADSVRILYISTTGKTFLLLHGFKKKKNKTPNKEIKVAKERLTDHKSRI